jgi:hypothetical protein
MYFVTTKHPDYVLFCMTPSERAALGLTEKGVVHLLVRGPAHSWQPLREWTVEECSHTDFMTSLAKVDEPADPRELLRYLPPQLRA